MVKTNPPTEADFLSHQARGIVPRSNDPETLRLHAGISVMDSEEGARALARRYPRMGRFIARLDIPDDNPFVYEKTGAAGHYTLWGLPLVLRAYVAAVTPVASAS